MSDSGLFAIDLFRTHGRHLGPGLLAMGMVWLTWTVCHVVTLSKATLDGNARFEKERRNRLRDGHCVYRWFEAVVDEIAALLQPVCGNRLSKLEQDLAVAMVHGGRGGSDEEELLEGEAPEEPTEPTVEPE